MTRLIGIVPLGIGLSTLIFAWSPSFGGGFGVPVFFRLFFSFIALAFVLTGGRLVFFGAPFDSSGRMIDRFVDMQQQLKQSMEERGLTPTQDEKSGSNGRVTSEGYVCPSCNAPIGSNADVSPHGDVKCLHCGRWFNVHG